MTETDDSSKKRRDLEPPGAEGLWVVTKSPDSGFAKPIAIRKTAEGAKERAKKELSRYDRETGGYRIHEREDGSIKMRYGYNITVRTRLVEDISP